MRFFAKTFDELTTHELYEIMRARAAVFVSEQKIVYPDADGLDYQRMHVFAADENGRVEAYLRMFRADGLPDAAQFGRVLTVHHGRGTGAQLMRFAERPWRNGSAPRKSAWTRRRRPRGSTGSWDTMPSPTISSKPASPT